ncbi:helix-turn-helix domain-containing protein [Streptomyces sp. J2-1]|uniref:helix-turn-helix domain-containing protein n=1 Tax=Streptomyces corallincola TaxID=2851888 RepID=UPI001C38A07C|nr:helix-turn-helix transcriptional regulator [Streptomyces corallincola]MBV2356899.1 helix-turn-helix domain-containing protein [Streptomyces corallincola]
MATPTIQRRRLGNALKRAREQAAKTQDEAAEQIDAAASKISRLELGQSGIKLTDLTLLLNFYGVSGEEAEWMKDLARAGRQRGRWSGFLGAIPDWFRTYVDLEADASELRWYQPEVVPGILQIESYIRAMNVNAQPGVSQEAMDQQLKVRLERQAILDQPNAPILNFILSESAIRRNIGDADVMREQLLHLAEVAERTNVELQVFPFDAQTFGAAWVGFTIMRFDHDASSDVVYLEDYTDATYLDRPDGVQAYTALWNRLQSAALGQVESRRMILRLAGAD